MSDIKQKAFYRSNFKPWRDLSKATKKQKTWYTQPENLRLLARKEIKLVAFLQIELFAKYLHEG